MLLRTADSQHKTLYNLFWRGLLSVTPFELPVALSRRQNRKPRVPNRCNDKSIDPRSAEVAQRIQFGHWESDTVLGRKKKGEPVAFTIVEGLTVFYLTIRISEKTSDGVAAAMQQLYSEFENRFSQIFRIITTDNGSGLAAFFSNGSLWNPSALFTSVFLLRTTGQ